MLLACLQLPLALEPVWDLLLAVHNGEPTDWAGIDRWYLIPCSSGPRKKIAHMSQRGLVFCPGYENYLEPAAASTAGMLDVIWTLAVKRSEELRYKLGLLEA